MALPQSVTPIIASNPDPLLEIIPFGDNPRVVLVENGQETLVQAAPPGTNFNFIRTVGSITSRPTNVIVGDKGTWVYDGKVNYFDGTTRKEVGTGTESILFKNGVLFFDAQNAPGKVFYFDGTTTTQVSDGSLVYSSDNAFSREYYDLLLATNKQGDLVTWKQADGKIALFDGQVVKTVDGSNIGLERFGRLQSVVGPQVVDISPDRVVYKSFFQQFFVRYTDPALNLTLGEIQNLRSPYFLQATPDYLYYVGNGGIVQRANNGSEKTIPQYAYRFDDFYTSEGTSAAVGNDLYFTSNDANGISQVYRFNENQAVQISQNTVNAKVTLFSINNRLLFTASDGNDAEIYSYDGTRLQQVTDNSIEDKPLAPIASADGSTFFWYQNTSDDVSGILQGELYNAVQNTFATFEISGDDVNQVSRAQFNAQNGLILADKQITLSLTPIDPPLSLNGTDGDDYLIGTGGNDIIAGLGGNDTVIGAAGNDILYGNDGRDQLDGGTGNDTIYGGNDNDMINGDDGNDLIFGNDGNDSINGGQGNDTIYGNSNDDLLQGGDGDDSLYGGSGSNTLNGGDGNDFLQGSYGPDTLIGGEGNDTFFADLAGSGFRGFIDAGRGDDFLEVIVDSSDTDNNIDGGEGFDTLKKLFFKGTTSGVIDLGNISATLPDGNSSLKNVEAVREVFSGEGDSNTIIDSAGLNNTIVVYGTSVVDGGGGNDQITDYRANSTLRGGEGDDTLGVFRYSLDPAIARSNLLEGGNGNDQITYTAYNYAIDLSTNATLNGGAGDDQINVSDSLDVFVQGGDGNDTISIYGGLNASDTIFGGDGDDFASGGDGNDFISGGMGDDTLYGDEGNDFAYGGLGNDSISGGSGIDNLEGNEGNDTIVGDDGDDGLAGQEGDDSLIGGNGDDRLYGWFGNDTLYGDDGNDTLYGDDGDDFAYGGLGNDSISGGSGLDNLEGNEGNDTIFGDDGDDGLAGQEGDDSLIGGNGDDRLYGWFGNDILQGDEGDDSLYGGSGNDQLTGGAGADTFNFGNDFLLGDFFASLGLDTITDFQSGLDKIQLQGSAFSALPATLSFATVADDSLAATRSEIIVYSQGTGSFFYNANGSAAGFGDGGSFAQLTGNPLVAATDFDLLPTSVLAV